MFRDLILRAGSIQCRVLAERRQCHIYWYLFRSNDVNQSPVAECTTGWIQTAKVRQQPELSNSPLPTLFACWLFSPCPHFADVHFYGCSPMPVSGWFCNVWFSFTSLSGQTHLWDSWSPAFFFFFNSQTCTYHHLFSWNYSVLGLISRATWGAQFLDTAAVYVCSYLSSLSCSLLSRLVCLTQQYRCSSSPLPVSALRSGAFFC